MPLVGSQRILLNRFNSILGTIFIFLLQGCDGIEEVVTSPNDIIRLEVSSLDGAIIEKEIVGDGQTIIMLNAYVPARTENAFREVTFKSNIGKFLESGNTSFSKLVNNDGFVKTEFKVPLSNQSVFFTAQIGKEQSIFRDEKSIDLIDVGQVVTLKVLDAEKQEFNYNIRGDGNIILTLATTVNFNQEDFSKIKFKNSGGGAFLGVNATEAKVNIDENNVAFLEYQIPNAVGRIFFEASVDGYDAIFNTASIDLIRSYPDSIVVEPAASSVALNENVSIDAYLLKSLGKVSQGTAPKFEAYQLADNDVKIEVGRFIGIPEAVTDGNGKVTVTFFADSPNIDQTKPILILVTSRDDDENIISELIQLEIAE